MSDFDKIRVRMTRVPFNYKWPRSQAVSVVRELGPCMIDAPIAEAAIKGGYAVPFEPAPAVKKAPTRRRSPSTRSARSVKVNDDAADTGKSADLDRKGLAGDGGAEDQSPMADAG